jgi:hypothetical protein
LAFFWRPLRLPKALHRPLSRHIRHAVRPRHCLADGAGLVEKDAVPELGIVAVRVEQGVGPVCLGGLGIGDR